MDKLTAILVDDEQDSRQILASYLAKYCPDVELLAACKNIQEGLSAITQHQPDLLFLDIEMPYGTGFDLLEQVGEVNFETVFVTAYDNYAIQALNMSAAYYLLKPVDIDELIQAVAKIKSERTKNSEISHVKILLDNIKETHGRPKKIMLPTFEGFEIVPIDQIVYCEADDNFTKFHLKGVSKPLLISKTLKHFEDLLPTSNFLRIHRSSLINIEYVIRYTKGKGGYVTMNNGTELEVSPKKKPQFLEAFRLS
ncbi:LytTR family DNA-binding domain-containing protein [Reichenbachiella carrageenanivorans]|uniref:LytTR family DNA-binding domain-containing protein n=1 Tax=Reichenbachiella carrageenanivorans TaxID=2979869 RepID=A0ABY6CWW9_9BACT|nr:LytTR family DNA-binding domain-containing protein [Reichenbachiella carrageenanivorans]UXX78419.1 LytTR family DNA-binding domain-containing protein [Reichenbachiella carrageenanivorans]